MSGATIPYHLRHNKAIDRNLFIDLLARVGRWVNISDYTYVGFGGPYLEEFKLLHGHLRVSKMISLEEAPNVLLRQRFNLPVSCIDLRQCTSTAFISSHEFIEPSIVWLDFTDPSKIGMQLAELELLVRKLKPNDVARITVNASPDALGKSKNPQDDLQQYRCTRAQDVLAGYCPGNLRGNDVTSKNYPATLLRAIENAAKKGMDTKSDCVLEPLTALSYADGQQMLTVTMAILEKEDKPAFDASTRLSHWPFKALDWRNVRPISVPQFSTKERLAVESILPGAVSPSDVLNHLGYLVGETQAEAEQLISNFLDYYRLFPWYSKVVL
jgi:hypothetical protein